MGVQVDAGLAAAADLGSGETKRELRAWGYVAQQTSKSVMIKL